MYLGMAIQAFFTQHLLGCAVGWNTRSAVHTTRVKLGDVALLAQPRLPANQQVLEIGAMGCMAIGAIFLHRRVFPQERTAFLGMAVIAGLVEGVARQQCRPGAAVWLMAIGAGDQPGICHRLGRTLNRVMGLTQELGALFLVALVAHLRLGLQAQHRIIGSVDSVAVNTCHRFQIMRAAGPVEALAIGVTTEANLIFCLDRCFVIEHHCRRWARPIGPFLHVILGGAMTGLALMLARAKG